MELLALPGNPFWGGRNLGVPGGGDACAYIFSDGKIEDKLLSRVTWLEEAHLGFLNCHPVWVVFPANSV